MNGLLTGNCQDVLQTIIDDLEQMKNLPTDYFEAKPQRAVGLDEVKAILVPNTMNKDLKQQLIDRGMNVVEYNPTKDKNHITEDLAIEIINKLTKIKED